MFRSRLRLTSTLALLVLALHQNAGSQTPAPEGAPRAYVREVGHDFGPVAAGGSLQHTFTVYNRGTAPLRILHVDASDPAMLTHFTETIDPGGVGHVTIRWTPEQTSGDLNGDAVVHFSDPQRPRITLTLTGVVKQSIAVRPSADVFVSLFADESAERRVTIVNNEPRALRIAGIRPAGDHFRAELATIDAGRTYEVVVSVPKGLRPGRYVGDIFVDTDHPRLGPIRLAVNTFVKDAMYVTPEVIDFGEVRLDRVRASESAPWLSQSSTLAKRKGDFVITAITSDIEGLRVHRSPNGRSSTMGLVVTLDRRHLHPGDLKGSIRIKTDDRQFPEIVLPVRGRIQ